MPGRASRHITVLLSFIWTALMGSALAWPAHAEAATFTFTKVADTSTAIPGGTGTFNFFDDPVLNAGSVAFLGGQTCFFPPFCPPSQLGIYTNIGGSLGRVADNTTAIPGGTGTFQFLGVPAVGAGTVAFHGTGGESEGIYAGLGGSLTRLADTSTAIPGGDGNFQSFSPTVAADGPTVAFVGVVGAGGSSSHLYSSSGGALTTLFDTSTPIPGRAGTFGGFASPWLDAGDVAFRGLGFAFEGIYVSLTGTLTKVADPNTTVPGGTGNFTFFGDPSLDAGTVTFVGFGPSFDPGIYATVGGVLTTIADVSTPVPGGAETFAFFSEPTIDNGRIAFVGVSLSGQFGLYLNAGGAFTTVIASGDVLDGKPVAFLHVSRGALSGDAIAFRAIFGDGSEGIFVATADPTMVRIDVKPGSVPNSINLGSGGVVPVAILSSSTFDATTADPTTVTLAGASVALRGKGTPMASFEDVDGDSLLDLIVQVQTDAFELSAIDIEAVLTATTYSGQHIRGTDSVRIVP